MASVNKVILVGNVGRVPELRYTPGGMAVASFSLATSTMAKDRTTGELTKRTEWHRIVAWDKLGTFCGEYLQKGKQIYVEGRLQTKEWQDRDGNKRQTTEIVAQIIQLLGPATREPRPEGNEYGHSPDDAVAPPEDDIPF